MYLGSLGQDDSVSKEEDSLVFQVNFFLQMWTGGRWQKVGCDVKADGNAEQLLSTYQSQAHFFTR